MNDTLGKTRLIIFTAAKDGKQTAYTAPASLPKDPSIREILEALHQAKAAK